MLKSLHLPVLIFLLAALMVAAPVGAANYDVTFKPDSESLSVSACFDPGDRVVLRIERTSAISNMRDANGPRRVSDRVVLPASNESRCLDYQVDLTELGRGSSRHRSWLPESSEWLFRPRWLAGSELLVHYPTGYGVSLPWPRLEKTATSARYKFDGTPASWSNLTMFGRLTQFEVALPGGEWRVSVIAGDPAVRVDEVRRWLERTAATLTSVYGRAPLASTQVLVVPAGRGSGPVPWGQVNRGGGAAVHLVINQTKPYDELIADWTAAHEVSHMLLPYLGTEGRWLSEGIASYYQNIARARTGELDQQQAFEKLHAGFQRGRKESRDGMSLRQANRAMRERRKYMQVYWSGAAFWLQADLALRKHDSSLDAVLAQLAVCHFPVQKKWRPERLVRRLDELAEELAGATVFTPLYQAMIDARGFAPMDQAYTELGLRKRGSRISLSSNAEQQSVRNELTQKATDGRVMLACAGRGGAGG